MPARAHTVCKSRGCSRITSSDDGYCERHAGEQRPGSWRGWDPRYDFAWKRLRAAVLDRDEHLCQPCRRAGRLTLATEVDHVTPRSLGGSESPENMQAICKACHRRKTAAEGASARHRATPRGEIPVVKL